MNKLNWRRTSGIVNTFVPRFIFKLSPRRFAQQYYWTKQKKDDPHGFDKYLYDRPQAPYLLAEVKARVIKTSTILDLGCNCGYYLKSLKELGFNNLTGVDISRIAIEFGKDNFNLSDVDLHIGSFEKIMPKFVAQGKKFDLIFSMGATVELVHPSFNIIKYLAKLSTKYVILFIAEWGHSTPRFYEYEFQKNGFLLVKCIRPFDGSFVECCSVDIIYSLLVFQKIA